ncbi:MAG: response regulator transcription factor, partial [Lachnospiraceae bacterium]|nr:response regulator transcription factor [Lachnospiraceae bacterium]
MNKRVLVVDDEKLIVKGIVLSLSSDGYEVDCAYDGEEAINMASAKEYDIILLDLMLPKVDGLGVCEAIRKHSNVPIIMLTAKGDDEDKIKGLDCGADDYITKPFNIMEVKARMKAIFRRLDGKGGEEENILSYADLKLDITQRRVYIGE